MLEPATYRIEAIQGIAWSMSLRWLVGDPEVGVDLTGWDCLLQVRERQSPASDVLVALTNDDIDVDGLGNLTARMDATTTATLPLGEYWYELELDPGPSGESVQLMRGAFRVVP